MQVWWEMFSSVCTNRANRMSVRLTMANHHGYSKVCLVVNLYDSKEAWIVMLYHLELSSCSNHVILYGQVMWSKPLYQLKCLPSSFEVLCTCFFHESQFWHLNCKDTHTSYFLCIYHYLLWSCELNLWTNHILFYGVHLELWYSSRFGSKLPYSQVGL